MQYAPISKLRILILILLIFLALDFYPLPRSFLEVFESSPPNQSKRVLFIGNSFTFGYELPRVIEKLSMQTSQPLDTEMYAPGGVYLDWHLKNQKTIEVLESKKWDIVVLQDCSFCPLNHKSYFFSGIRGMVSEARRVGAKPMLFMTWADLGQDSDQNIIAKEYLALGKELDVEVVPVGLAWQRALSNRPSLKLHDADEHHAGPQGALLSAYVFLDTLQDTALSPAGLEMNFRPRVLHELFMDRAYADSETRVFLAQIAAQVSKDFRAKEGITK